MIQITVTRALGGFWVTFFTNLYRLPNPVSYVAADVPNFSLSGLKALTLAGSLVFICLSEPARADMTWHWNATPSAYGDTITSSMNQCVATWNAYANYNYDIGVRYSSGTPTADAGYMGEIRFGGQRSYRTAMHESGHWMGSGTVAEWIGFFRQNSWTGTYAYNLRCAYDGPGERTERRDSYHYTPYAANYDQEGVQGAQMVGLIGAFRCDMGLTDTTIGIASDTYRLRNRQTIHMLDNLGATAEGSQVKQADNGTSTGQQWAVSLISGTTYFTIKNVASNKYLDTLGSTTSGSPVVLTSLPAGGASDSQLWQIVATDSFFFRFVNKATGKVLDNLTDAIAGAGIVQTTSGSSWGQQWTIVHPSVQNVPDVGVISQGRPVTASTAQVYPEVVTDLDPGPGHVWKANNGVAGDYWAASSTSYPQWIRVDLGSVQPITKVVTDWLTAGGRSYKYRVETSDDDVSYTTRADRTGNTTSGTTTDVFAGTARYVRLAVTGCSVTGSAAINEFRVYNEVEPMKLLSQYRPATASSQQQGNLAVNAADVDAMHTRWTANTNTYPQWWQVDLGSAQQVNKAVIEWFGDGGRSYKYRIEGSTNGSTFTTLLDRTGNTLPDTSVDSFSGAARYVRITVTGCSVSGNAAFYDAQIFGSTSSSSVAFSSSVIQGGQSVSGVPFTGTIAGTAASPNGGITYSKASGPSWLIVAADGTLSGTPGFADEAGEFLVRATDSLGGTALAILEIDNARDGVWLSDTDGNWDDTAKWSNGLPASGSNHLADFSTLNISADRTVTLQNSRTIGQLSFGDSSGGQGWNLAAVSGKTLTLGGLAEIAVNQNTTAISAVLAGTSGLTKSGAGKLVLSAANTYTGGTTINGGILAVQNSNGIGAGAVTIPFGTRLQISNGITVGSAVTYNIAGHSGSASSAAADAAIENLSGSNTLSGGLNFSATGGSFVNLLSTAGSLVLGGDLTAVNVTGTRNFHFTGSGNMTANGVISNGSATVGVVKSGAGTLTLAGANTYTGGTTISAGRLYASAGGLSGGRIDIAGGAILTFTGNNQTNPSIVAGTGDILNSNASTTILTGDHSGFSGTFTHSAAANNTQFNSATSGSKNAAYTLTGGELIFALSGDYTVKFGSLASTAGNIRGGNTATGTTTLEVGNLGTNSSIAGNLNNGSTKVLALTKVGGGTLTLLGTNNYSGATTVTAGALMVNGTVTGTSAVAVSNGGTLAGSGTIPRPVTVAVGGAIAPGDGAGNGTLGLSSALTLSDGSVLKLKLGAPRATPQLSLTAAPNATGKTRIDITGLAGFGAGTYPLISTGSTILVSNFEMGTAPGGFSYDLTAAGGTLSLSVTAPLAAPTGLTATGGNLEVQLSWTASLGATGYNVLRSGTSGGGYSMVPGGSGVASTTFTDSGLVAGTTYYYVVTAVNGALQSPNSNEASATATAFTPSQTWRQQNFGTTSAVGVAAENADPDQDGVCNLLERAFGTNPNLAERIGSPAVDPAAPLLSIVYRRAKAATDLEYVIEESTDLSPNSWDTSQNGTSVVLGETEDHTADIIRFTAPPGSGTKFLRLQVKSP
jgi:autotransporter-associated beta strand protein